MNLIRFSAYVKRRLQEGSTMFKIMHEKPCRVDIIKLIRLNSLGVRVKKIIILRSNY